MTPRDAQRADVVPDSADSGYGAAHRRTSPLHDWRLKAAVQTVLSRIPHGVRINYALQRRVTRTLPISDQELVAQVLKARRHLDAYRRLVGELTETTHLYEFGVGWDLVLPLTYFALGIDRQTVVDIQRLARLELVIDTVERLRRHASELELPRPPESPSRGQADLTEVLETWGIDYRAPADARAVDLPDGSVDLVTSTDVLEHVPPDDIKLILAECRRLLRPGGLIRIRIDYQDHYWYFDDRLTPYNFLKFGEERWRRFNPPLHFQNRLRHSELIALATGTGLSVIEDDHSRPTSSDLELLDQCELSTRFRHLAPEDVAIRFANLSLR